MSTIHEFIQRKPLTQIIISHVELVAALFSGILILIAWLVGNETSSIILYILAFVIGGFAKAKEGMEATIRDKELNVEMLMILAAIGSSIIGYWTEGAILIFIFAVSGALETYTMNKSDKEISSLMELQPEEAWKLNSDGTTTRVSINELTLGDHLVVKPGERIPADGIVMRGATSIDEAAISGESIPVSKQVNDELFAGTVNISGAITMEMTKANEDSLFQKIIQLVQSAQDEKSPAQQFIERFEGTYVKVVLIVVGFMLFLPHFLLDWDWNTTFYRAMVLLVVASPCALVASIMPATLSAISNGAKNGILFKGGVHLENVSEMKAIALDKTGTLTQGKPIVTDFFTREDLDFKTTLTTLATIEAQSNHPLAQAITAYAKINGIDQLPSLPIEDKPGFGLLANINGQMITVGKPDFVNKEDALAFHQGIAETLAAEGKTVIFMRDEKGIAAAVALKDTVREEAKEAIKLLHSLGIKTVMLTGDNETTAKAIAKEAGIDQYYAECLPETKVEKMKTLLKEYKFVGMVGDGINDAPALATATTGFAMGEGTDVALETADVVLMKNDLSKIAYAVKMSRKMQRIVKQNIIFSLSVIAVLIISNFLQAVDLPLGVIGHEGSTILVILNGLRMLNRN
ncbi:heavy metal translocating P-type ATPase [Psychrobacillus lasiicapitis]|uniref:P-type Cu(+) transporter n=1 Tax=Psychrobacillus lasiicapitis TaxID=1636719 RepID=A0A544SYA6_9BACI|nr:heavy metal translocating P-type ATPase [Psychrobacillus lasiicapitis]TQR10186.1 cadmium-translocating P-type ATPase [Psychrobacillus lasiicapitis]GGA46128.1 ATPase [Psychrobacillus lasiicapitis]